MRIALGYALDLIHLENPRSGEADVTTMSLEGGCSTCADEPYESVVNVTGTAPPYMVIWEAGVMPPGLTLSGNVISGTPTTPGRYAPVFRVIDATGAYLLIPFYINVVGITTEALDPFVVGTPYSFQMEAEGGMGTYAWTMPGGTLPLGLSMSESGLISGTPSEGGERELTFRVTDTACGAVIPEGNPRAESLTCVSTTRLATRHGLPGFLDTNRLFREVTYEGTAEQRLFVRFPDSDAYYYWKPDWPPLTRWYEGRDIPTYATDNFCTAVRCAQAKYIWSGTTIIDDDGNVTQMHAKNLYGLCPSDLNDPAFYTYQGYWNDEGEPVFMLSNYSLIGYCWELDPLSCTPCMDDNGGNPALNLIRDEAVVTNLDWPSKFVPWGLQSVATTDTTQHITGTPDPLEEPWSAYRRLYDAVTHELIRDTQLPRSPYLWYDWDDLALAVIEVAGEQDFTVTLANEYTYAQALANAVEFVSNSDTAVTLTDNLTWGAAANGLKHVQSRYTSVDFTIQVIDLLVGFDYIVSYDLLDTLTSVTTVVDVPLTATDTEMDVLGSVPTPAEGHSIKVRNARVRFA